MGLWCWAAAFHMKRYCMHALPNTIDLVISPRNCFPVQTVFEAVSAEP